MQCWNLMRWVRLVLGLAALWQAWNNRDVVLGAAGLLLLATAILNVGCCGSSCPVPIPETKKKNEVTHEELPGK